MGEEERKSHEDNNRQHEFSAYYVPHTVLSHSHILSLNHHNSHEACTSKETHYTEEDMEVQELF